MDCKEFSNLLDAYLDGALDTEEARRLEEHAAGCGACADMLTLRKDCRLLDAQTETPEAFAASWRQRIKEEEAMDSAPKPRKWTGWLAAAAALVFVIGGTALTRDSLPTAQRPAASAKKVSESRAALKTAESAGDYGALMAAGAATNVSFDDYDMAAEEAEEYEAAAEAPMAAEAAVLGDESAARTEKIIRTASFAIRTADYEADLQRLQEQTAALGGRVESLSASGDADSGQSRSAYLTLRIPTERLDEFLSQAKEIGSVTDMTEERRDVSDSYYDTRSRLETQKEKLSRLQALMQSAQDVSDLVDIESAIADAQYWIDRYTSQLQRYDSQVDYSTVYASLREVKVTEMEDVSLGRRILEGLRASLQGGVDFLQDAAVFLAAALPWLAVAGLVILGVRWIVRKNKKRAKNAQ